MNSASRTRDAISLLRMIIQALVSDVEQVAVTSSPLNEQTLLLQVKVSDRDRGKVIGKSGRIARSIRIVFLGIQKERGGKYQIDFPS